MCTISYIFHLHYSAQFLNTFLYGNSRTVLQDCYEMRSYVLSTWHRLSASLSFSLIWVCGGVGGVRDRRRTMKEGQSYSASEALHVQEHSLCWDPCTNPWNVIPVPRVSTPPTLASGKSRLAGNGLFKMSLLASFSLICSVTSTELHNHSIYIQFWHLIL